ncbi:DUF1425 domain-containing protein [Campylobacter sp. RM16192]|uniref:DUF1425 domain-containing protein n=1 Tax=Campylobacter sp. RM16192 TaxID=1660080 RepID=UPI001451DE9B|nr:YcfL family protein [Campylobacter sp. RM16192]QCD52160.1 putative periplasmic lipoprotein (DUF1425 domain) [Campylobacter sp. RM16192]
MKKISILLVAVLMFLGCSPKTQNIFLPSHGGTSLIQADGISEDVIRDVRHRINQNGLLEAEIVFFSSSTQNIFYKLTWFDEGGFVLRDSITDEYRTIYLNKNREAVVKYLASNKDAKTFKIYITNKGTK